MKKILAILLTVFICATATAQMENSIVLDTKSFRAVQQDALTGVNIDPIGLDHSRQACARNVTRAGVHADGLMKDEEIYTIFDTRKILGKPPTVQISKTSGLAGIAYWINQNYGLEGDAKLDKRAPLVVAMKEWVDLQ